MGLRKVYKSTSGWWFGAFGKATNGDLTVINPLVMEY